MTPPASLVVLVYNTRELAVQCLANFYDELVAQDWQLIVVDNASTDGTAQAVRGRFSAVQVIRSERNLGFAGGNNLGIRAATGDVIILLNSDVIATARTLQALAGELRAQPLTGALSPGLVTGDGQPQAFAYGHDPTLGYLLSRGTRALLGLGALHSWSVTQPVETDWVSGACLCVKRAVVQQIGPLDESYFLYFEDTDWCLRMRQAGWRIVYDPRFKVTHLGGASQTRHSASGRIYYRSLVTFYHKHYGPLATLLLRIALLPYTILSSRARSA